MCHRNAVLRILIFAVIITCFPFSLTALPAKVSGSRPSVGLVLSGGGTKGLAHIGVLKVLEEAGIQIDYIAGTSIGAIIGGLYAMGYKAETLEEILLEQDWASMLLDPVERRDLSMAEKEQDGKYIGRFPLSKGRISLPKGLVAGQKITLMLTRLTVPFHHVRDFTKLPIPFLCMATDIETGKPVVMDHGFLPEAMRASMSIPFVFNPVELNGHLLLDGGIVRNFPVSDAQNMGADIVIGVDVGSNLYSKGQLASMDKIVDQCISFMKDESTRNQRKMCDVLITPDIGGSDTFSFDSMAGMVERGEQAAREKIPEIKQIAGMLNYFPPRRQVAPLAPPDFNKKIPIRQLVFKGLKKVSEHVLKAKLRIRVPSERSIKQIQKAVDRAYGTQFFERLTYRLDPLEDGFRLTIRVIEQNTHFFNFGVRYDSDMKAAFLLNNTFRNPVIQGSRLSLDARLGQNVLLKGSFFVHTGWRPGIGCGINLEGHRYNIFTYRDNKRNAHYEHRGLAGNIILQTIFSNAIVLGGGIQKEFDTIKPIISSDLITKRDDEYLNFLGYIKVDTQDRAVYPRKGGRFYSEIKATTDWLTANDQNKRPTFERVFVSYKKSIPLSDKTTFLGHYFLGSIEGDEVPEEYLFYFGGLDEHIKRDFPFVGYDYMQIAGKNAHGLQAGLQYEFKTDTFLIFRSNAGKVAEQRGDVFNHNDLFYGYGLTLGYYSVIGPMELTVTSSSTDNNPAAYINVGYGF